MIDIEDHTAYSFQYVDCDGKVYTTKFNNPGPTWMECLDDFVSFLESVYKYDIRSKIRLRDDQQVKNNPWPYIDPWSGEYYVPEEESKENTHFSWDE